MLLVRVNKVCFLLPCLSLQLKLVYSTKAHRAMVILYLYYIPLSLLANMLAFYVDVWLCSVFVTK